jgi:DGQHR domain-containing protein
LPKIVHALKIRQWLEEWERVTWDSKQHRSKPLQYFYLFALPANELKALTGIQRRTTEDGLARSKDIGIQRRHDKDRSEQIADYVKYGYPWSILTPPKRDSGEFQDLRKPGWLPTAIVVNILKPDDTRYKQQIDANDVINVSDSEDGSSALISLPKNFSGADWSPTELHPIEVIDGQHRLWAFDYIQAGDFQLPVVAFQGLDLSWQAYLFWTINIRPQRINPSLAYDLYPLLRMEDWLSREESYFVYRETRAQELVEALWSHQASPWYRSINMLGEPTKTPNEPRHVSQSAWIRSLMATYVKPWEPRTTPIGGLFGGSLGQDREVLRWSRAQQAAFLILVGRKIRDAIKACDMPWAEALRHGSATLDSWDSAFLGKHSLLNTDQGIRGILYITNDLCYVKADELALEEIFKEEEEASAADEEAVTRSLNVFERNKQLVIFLEYLARGIAQFDWRASSEPSLTLPQRTEKLVFRGSGGYRELRRQMLVNLTKNEQVGKIAKRVLEQLGY